METNNKYTAYYRTPTKKMKLWGISIQEQVEKIDNFIKLNNSEILARFIETGSAKTERNICLIKAIDKTIEMDCQLVLADSMLIYRDLEFLYILEKSKVRFLCIDLPDFNERNIKVFRYIAEQRRATGSLATKEALRVKQTNGTVLGNPKRSQCLTREIQKKGALANRLKSFNDPANKQAFALASILRKDSFTLEKITEELNKNGFKTPKGNSWMTGSVDRLLKKFEIN